MRKARWPYPQTILLLTAAAASLGGCCWVSYNVSAGRDGAKQYPHCVHKLATFYLLRAHYGHQRAHNNCLFHKDGLSARHVLLHFNQNTAADDTDHQGRIITRPSTGRARWSAVVRLILTTGLHIYARRQNAGIFVKYARKPCHVMPDAALVAGAGALLVFGLLQVFMVVLCRKKKYGNRG